MNIQFRGLKLALGGSGRQQGHLKWLRQYTQLRVCLGIFVDSIQSLRVSLPVPIVRAVTSGKACSYLSSDTSVP